MNDSDDYFVCPHCGAELPANASFCQHCGSSDESGWKDDFDALDEYSADDEFDYDEFVQREFGTQAIRPNRSAVTVIVVGLMVISLVILTLPSC